MVIISHFKYETLKGRMQDTGYRIQGGKSSYPRPYILYSIFCILSIKGEQN